MTDVEAEFIEEAIYFLAKKAEALTGAILELIDTLRGAPAFEIPADDPGEGYTFEEDDGDEDEEE